MANLLSSVNMALQAMMAHQQSIEVSQNNVANANTPGYRRQSATLVNAMSGASVSLDHGSGAGLQGMGVVVDRIQRFSFDFYDNRYRQISASSKRWEMQQSALQQAESLLAETASSGLMPQLDQFFTGWQTLAANPEENAIRTDLLSQANSLASSINSRARQLIEIRTDVNQQVVSRVDEVNSIAQKISGLNQQISQVIATGQQPNDLLDARDRSLDRLSELIGATSSLQPNGEVLVTVSNHVLVMGTEFNKLQVQKDPTNDNYVNLTWGANKPLKLTNGEIAGYIDARDGELRDQQTALNTLATNLMDRVNTVHRQGFGLNNRTNLNFFDGTDALSMGLSTQITSADDIAASSTLDAPGNSTNAVLMWDIRNETLMNGNSESFQTYYNNQITSLGQSANYAKSQSQNNKLILSSLDMQRESLSGVSLDEEAVNLMKSQKAFEAAARVMTTMDEMLDKIINGMGIVGR